MTGRNRRDAEDEDAPRGGGSLGASAFHFGLRGPPLHRHELEPCRVLAPGGGFVFQQVHNVMANIPPENMVAMFDAEAEFNR